MTDGPTEEPAAERAPTEDWDALGIGTAWRGGLGIGGTALLAVAAVSTLRGDNELGTAALAVIGAVLVLLAALGQWPSRFTWGDKSAEFRARRVRQEFESGADNERVAEVAVALAETPLEFQLARQISSLETPSKVLERFALERLNELSEADGEFVTVLNASGSPWWDARLARHPHAPFPDSVGVVVTAGEQHTPGTGYMGRLVNRISRIFAEGGFRTVLVIADDQVPRIVQQQIDARLESAGVAGPVIFANLLDRVNFRTQVKKSIDTLPPHIPGQ